MKGVEGLEHLDEAWAGESLGEHVGKHVVAGHVFDDDGKLGNDVAEVLGAQLLVKRQGGGV